MSERGFRVGGLGEVAVRTANLEAMTAFYRDVIGLEILAGNYGENIVFFGIAEGFGGHTAVLALFAADEAPVRGGSASTLHHLALSLPFDQQQAVMDWFDRNWVAYRVEEFGWVGWRGIFATDPDGNTVELVAFDASLLKS